MTNPLIACPAFFLFFLSFLFSFFFFFFFFFFFNFLPCQGVETIRNTVARFLEERDKAPCSASDVFLSNGASECITHVLNALIAHPNVGIMIPIPQYPL